MNIFLFTNNANKLYFVKESVSSNVVSVMVCFKRTYIRIEHKY